MSTGFKAASGVTAVAVVLALAGALPGAEALTCDASREGAPCTSPYGFPGLCRRNAMSMYDCWKKCDASNVGTTCISAFGFTGVCQQTTASGDILYGCWEKACSKGPGHGSCEFCGKTSECDAWTSHDAADAVCVTVLSAPWMLPGFPCGGGRPGTCQASGDCQVSGGAASDPVITGFDGQSFHFDQTGNFTLLSSGDGFKVDVTFVGASTEAKVEKCWTSSVRFTASNGDMVACTLPAIQPNTSQMQVTSTPASSPAQVTLLSPSNPSMTLAGMAVRAVLSDSGDVTGCQVTTATMQATVYQVSGYEQAAQHPEEAWAAPYTWLNTDIKLTKPLPAPVTGILGATYPVDEAVEAEFLRALEEPAGGVEAGVAGETGSRRQLAGAAGPFILQSSLVGFARPEHEQISR